MRAGVQRVSATRRGAGTKTRRTEPLRERLEGIGAGDGTRSRGDSTCRHAMGSSAPRVKEQRELLSYRLHRSPQPRRARDSDRSARRSPVPLRRTPASTQDPERPAWLRCNAPVTVRGRRYQAAAGNRRAAGVARSPANRAGAPRTIPPSACASTRQKPSSGVLPAFMTWSGRPARAGSTRSSRRGGDRARRDRSGRESALEQVLVRAPAPPRWVSRASSRAAPRNGPPGAEQVVVEHEGDERPRRRGAHRGIDRGDVAIRELAHMAGEERAVVGAVESSRTTWSPGRASMATRARGHEAARQRPRARRSWFPGTTTAGRGAARSASNAAELGVGARGGSRRPSRAPRRRRPRRGRSRAAPRSRPSANPCRGADPRCARGFAPPVLLPSHLTRLP